MGMFDNLPGYIKISDKPFFNLGGILNGFLNKVTGAGLTPAEREANAFTAEREDIAWQREMNASNTQYQRSVADMQAAGINPMMAVSNGGASVPSASSSGSVSPSPGNLGEILSAVLGFQKFGIEKMLAEKQGKVFDEQAGNIAADTALKKQTESESKERERGARIVNDIKEATKENEIEAAKLRNNLTRAQEKAVYKGIDEACTRMSKNQAETDSEYEKQNLMRAQRALQNATAWQIYQLTPALNNYYNAQGQAARGAAAAAFVKAAYDYELIDNGYVDSIAKEAAAKAGIAGDEQVIKDIAVALRTGDWQKLEDMNIMSNPANYKFGPDRFIGNKLNEYLQGATVLMDNLNPLAKILQ